MPIESQKHFEESPENNFPRKRKCLNKQETRKLLQDIIRLNNLWETRKNKENTSRPMKKYLRRSNSQVHRGNAIIWPNHRMMRAVIKKIVTCKICKIPWIELTEKCGNWVQCAICDEYICPKRYDKRYFCRWWFFFFASFQLGFLIAHVKLACLIHTKFLQQM